MTYIASLDPENRPTPFEEECSEFNAEVPDWERRLAEYDRARFIPETEMAYVPDHDGFHRGSIEDWDWKLSLS